MWPRASGRGVLSLPARKGMSFDVRFECLCKKQCAVGLNSSEITAFGDTCNATRRDRTRPRLRRIAESGRRRTRFRSEGQTQFRCDSEQHSGLKANTVSGGKANTFVSSTGIGLGLERNVFHKRRAGEAAAGQSPGVELTSPGPFEARNGSRSG